MEAGPFVAGELLANVLKEAFVGSFFLTRNGPIWVAGLASGAAPNHVQSILLTLDGQDACRYPSSSVMPRNGLQVSGRIQQITIGEMVGNADPVAGDLGVAADGELVVAVRITMADGPHDILMSLASGKQVTEISADDCVWVRQWRLDLVSPDGVRAFTILDRFFKQHLVAR